MEYERVYRCPTCRGDAILHVASRQQKQDGSLGDWHYRITCRRDHTWEITMDDTTWRRLFSDTAGSDKPVSENAE